MKKIGFILVVFVLLVGCASTGPSIKEGNQAPDFSLVNVSGDEIRLSDFNGKKNVALIFYGDHGWRACRDQLGELQERISDIEKLNAEVIAVSTGGNQQDVETSKGSLRITYTLIPKPNREVVENYGLSYDSFGAAYATFIIDKKGRIRFKSVDSGSVRTSVSQIIRELQGL